MEFCAELCGAVLENFYSKLKQRSFWRSGVVDVSPLALADIYSKKWTINPEWEIGTAGSCFAQHIARYMTQNGYNVLDVETAPNGLKPERRQAYGYALYSGRYGNIYTTRQFRQLIEETYAPSPQEVLIWEKDGRFYDALRPNIEPSGFATAQEVADARAYHLERLRILFCNVDMFVFTMGLTEAWVHQRSGRVVPIAPGIIAGGETAPDYSFVNFSYPDVVADFQAAMAVLEANRSKPLRYLLTVSPVPLTATATGGHILTASTYSKAVLRAAAGFLSDNNDNIDYFPSYEIVTNPGNRGTFFAANLRSVRSEGVEVVMKSFFAQHPPETPRPGPASKRKKAVVSTEDVQCEEALLGAFGK